MKAIYPGSFDPITYGHLDIIERAAEIFDEVVIVIMKNDGKQSLFSDEEKLEMINECIKDMHNVSVMVGSGLTVEFAKSIGATIMVRGIRAVTDYEYEMQLATANMSLDDSIHTVFLASRPEYSFLSSSVAKTVASCHGDISHFVPPCVQTKLQERY